MASEKKTTKITVNTAEAQTELKALREELKQTREEYKTAASQAAVLSDSLAEMSKTLEDMEKNGLKGSAEFNELEKAFEEGSNKAKQLKQEMADMLQTIKTDANAIKTLDDQLTKCDAVIQDLANSSMRQLSAATKETTRQLRNMSANSEGLDDMHDRLDKLTRETKIVKGEFVDVSKGIGNLSVQSDKWLDKAIRTQQDLVASLKKTDAEYEKQAKILKRLQDESTGRKTDRLSSDALKDIIKRGKEGKATIDELNQAYRQLEQEMKSINTGDYGFKNRQRDMQELKAQIDEVTGAVNDHGDSWKDALTNLLGFAAGFEVLDTLKDKLQQVIEKTFEFGDAQADVKKVTGLADQDIARLSDRLSKLDTRTTLTDLHTLAYEGGKLGIGEYGVAGLQSYVEAANKIKVALGDDLGEDAMLPLAKMGEVMGLFNGTAESVGQGILQIGSALNELTQSSSSAADHIVDFGTRVQGMAAYLHLSTADMLALGSAADAAGLSMETSGTSFSMFLAALQKSPDAIEKALHIEDGTINQLVNSGQTMEAILLVLDKMKEAGNMHNLEDAFKALGSEGARMVGVLATMSEKVDMVRDHVDVSRQAFREATSVTNEYNVQNETASAIMERANNMWNNLFVNTEGVDNVKAMSQMWYDLSKSITTNSVVMASAKMTLDMLKLSLQAVIALLPVLIGLLMGNGLLKAFSVLGPMVVSFGRTVAANFALVSSALHGSTMAAGRLTVAWRTMSLAMKANAIMLAISVVGELAYAIYNLTQKTNEAHDAVIDFSKDVADAGLQSAAAESKVRRFADAIERAGKNEKERNNAIAAFNKQFGQYMSHLLTEKSTALDVANAYAEVVKNMRAKALLEAKQKGQKAVDQKYVESRQRSNQFESLTQGTSNDIYNRDWLENYIAEARKSGKKWQQVAREIGGKLGVASLQTENIITDNAGQAVLGDVRVGKSGLGRKATIEEKQLHAAIRTVLQSYAADDAQQKLDYTYKGLDTTVGGPEAETPDEIKNTETDSERKKRLAEERKAAAAARKELNDEKNQAKAEVNNLIANIKAFYEEQQRKYLEWVAEQNADEEKVSEGQQKLYIEHLQTRMNQALGKARQSIATLDDGFKQFYEHMDEDVAVFDDETSRQLLESIGKSNIKELHDLFSKLSGDLSRENNRTLAENLGALLDQIFANGSKELREAAEKIIQRQRELQKIIMEEDYVGQATRQTRSNLDQYQLLKPTADVRADTTEGVQQISDAFDKMIEKSRKDIYSLYEIDPESENFKESMVAFFSDVSDTFDFAALNASELHALYRLLIDDETRFEQAQKKQDEARKKVNDKRYSRNPQTDAEKRAIDQGESVVAQQGIYGNLDFNAKDKKWEAQSVGAGISQGIGTNTDYFNDPEIMLDRLRLESKQRYFEEIARLYKVGEASEDDYREAQKSLMLAQNQLAKDLASNIAQQTGNLMSFLSPLQSFGESVGEAFATMHDDAASGRKAVADALKSMTKSFAKATLDIIQQNLMRQLNNELTNSTMLLQDSAFAAGKQSIAAMMYANLLMQQAAFNGETLSMEAALTQAEVALNSAQATAKGFAQLGPIGGPVAIAAMMAVIGAALSYALSMAFRGSNNKTKANVNTKLASEMLTYDEGNLYLADNGRIYSATEGTIPANGVRMFTHPTATTVNGQRALVAENGPELVVGRETTRYIQQNDPELLRTLITYDRNHSGRHARRTYDDGNLSGVSLSDTSTNRNIETSTAANTAAMMQAMAQMTTLLQSLNDNGIKASLDMWGYNGAMETLARGQQFKKRH